MYSILSVSKRLVLPHILVVVATQLLLTRSVSSLNMTNTYLHHKCNNTQGKYKPGSEYEKGLTHITQTISPTSNFRRGYKMMSLGGDGNFVAGTPMGPNAAPAMPLLSLGKCPEYKGGIIWYDQCLLEFSGIDTVYQIDYENNFCMSNPKNLSDDQTNSRFQLQWDIFIDNLTTIATEKGYSDKTPFYAAGERRIGTNKMYGMVQCTEDVSIEGCQECIGFQMVGFQNCLFAKRGARVLGRSCNMRFEFYPFVPNSLKM